MNIYSYQYHQHLDEQIFADKTVVVIDVFRATSVITTALAHGVKAIYTIDSVERALHLANSTHQGAMLGGERKMLKPEGFDIGNSPQDYMNCAHQEILLTTTNGTAAIQKTLLSKCTIIAALLNADAVAKELCKNHDQIVLLISGLRGEFSLEDGVCAGKIIKLLSEKTTVSIDDFSHVLLKLYQAYQHNLSDCLTISSASQRLKNNGFEADVDFCKQEDIYQVVPFCSKKDDLIKITLRE